VRVLLPTYDSRERRTAGRRDQPDHGSELMP
jgi:hypothetical protein